MPPEGRVRSDTADNLRTDIPLFRVQLVVLKDLDGRVLTTSQFLWLQRTQTTHFSLRYLSHMSVAVRAMLWYTCNGTYRLHPIDTPHGRWNV